MDGWRASAEIDDVCAFFGGLSPEHVTVAYLSRIVSLTGRPTAPHGENSHPRSTTRPVELASSLHVLGLVLLLLGIPRPT